MYEAIRYASPDVIVHQLTDLTGVDLASNAWIRSVATRTVVDAAQQRGISG